MDEKKVINHGVNVIYLIIIALIITTMIIISLLVIIYLPPILRQHLHS